MQLQISAAERQALVRRAQRDPIYGSAYAIHGSVEMLLEGGFFDDLGPDDADAARAGVDWLMTPTFKITDKLQTLGSLNDDARLLVLLCTGAFCPIHDGHVEQLNIAKDALEAQGHLVLGGYLSISHDMYVSQKCGNDTLSAQHRLRLCEEACAESDWLMADGWEALGTVRSLNFSDVMVRLEAYLAKHIQTRRPIEVAYVFGSDHARFSRAFIGKGSCVCTLRPGYEDNFYRYANEPGIRDNPRILFAPGQERTMSSTAVRRGSDNMMVERARRVYRQWKANALSTDKHRASYFLRDEEDWSTAGWLVGRAEDSVQTAWDAYVHQLMKLLRTSHTRAAKPDISYDVVFRLARLRDQRGTARGITRLEQVISMDPCIAGDVNLGVCREFPHSASCVQPKIAHRPGTAPLAVQAEAIPAGDWVLMDDDIATGRTVAHVLKLLPKGVRVKRVCALTQRAVLDDTPILDILDCRDFLAGSRMGGLVVTLPNGERGRVPYCLPYVSPADRASTPLSQEINFSHDVWSMNSTFFRRIDMPILLREADPGFRTAMRYIGFTDDTPLEEITDWHKQYMARMMKAAASAEPVPVP